MTETPGKADFTTSDEIDSLDGGDDTTVIMGYVDGIECNRKVGDPPKSLFKFILNNDDGRRIRIAMWQDKADIYEAQIVSRTIVRITRGTVVPINPQYYKTTDKIVRNEISVTRRTKVELLGIYQLHGLQNSTVSFKKVELSEIAESTGPVCVEGYIKAQFVAQTSGHASYGSGAITDGIYKLRVQIADHANIPKLVEGVHIRVQGLLKKDKYGSDYLQAQAMSDIEIVDDTMMSISQLSKGFRRSLKRSFGSDGGEANKENMDEIENKKKKTSSIVTSGHEKTE